VCGITFEAWPVAHSVIAPAAGYRVPAAASAVFYAPDVLGIANLDDVLRGIRLYVGDGATLTRPIVRIERQKGVAVGHAPIATQLDWCARAGVARAIFTHCGRAIVAGPPSVGAQISELGRARHVVAEVAYDGLQTVLG
jgi:phosphoribosyl 1,2-cyclic phosphodiesterase